MAKKKKNREPKLQPVVRGFRLEDLRQLEPKTEHQNDVFEAWRKGNHVCMIGSAGSGKTLLAVYLALKDVLADETGRKRLVIVRSAVPTRDIGFMPGDRAEKEACYVEPYQAMINWLFGSNQAWSILVANHVIEFRTTSFLRGLTIDDAIVLIEEAQNMTAHELESVATRMGESSRLAISGDGEQTDFERERDKAGFGSFLKILEAMKGISIVEFGWEDCLRSAFVREFLMTKAMLDRERKKK